MFVGPDPDSVTMEKLLMIRKGHWLEIVKKVRVSRALTLDSSIGEQRFVRVAVDYFNHYVGTVQYGIGDGSRQVNYSLDETAGVLTMMELEHKARLRKKRG